MIRTEILRNQRRISPGPTVILRATDGDPPGSWKVGSWLRRSPRNRHQSSAITRLGARRQVEVAWVGHGQLGGDPVRQVGVSRNWAEVKLAGDDREYVRGDPGVER